MTLSVVMYPGASISRDFGCSESGNEDGTSTLLGDGPPASSAGRFRSDGEEGSGHGSGDGGDGNRTPDALKYCSKTRVGETCNMTWFGMGYESLIWLGGASHDA